jgi:hypothetical protein
MLSVVFVAASTLCFGLSQLFTAPGGAVATSTSTTSTTSTTSPAVSALPTSPGSAVASASVVTTGPAYGGYNLSVSTGDSAVSYQGSDASASSQDVYLGQIGSLLFSGQPSACSSSASASPVSSLNALTADSGGGEQSKSGGNQVEGTEAVTVNPSPESASATTTPINLNVAGLIDVIGQSTASVLYTANQEQTAIAKTVLDIDLGGGEVDLDGATWSVDQATGATPAANGSFTVASIKVGGTTYPVLTQAEVTEALKAANSALSTFGLSVVQPAATNDSATNAVNVSGMEVRLTGSVLTNAVLEPLLAQEPAIEKAIDAALASNACAASLFGDADLVGNIVLGIMAGAGQATVILGGANAGSSLAPPVFQFGSSGGAFSFTSPSTGSTFLPSPGSTFLPTTGALPTAPTGGSTSTTTAPTKSALGASVPASLHCETTSPSGRPGCVKGLGDWIAAGLLAIALTLFAVDFVTSRRRRFAGIKETTA